MRSFPLLAPCLALAALCGFGQGQTDIQVVTTIDDLSQGPPKPLYEVATDANSGNMPGAAPTLVLGPYGAAVRFVMAGQDLDKNLKQTAAKIAEQLAKRIQQGAQPASRLPNSSAHVKVGRAVPSAPCPVLAARTLWTHSTVCGALGTARPTAEAHG